jgi:hypothetical protein
LEQILLELGYDPEIAKLISDEAQPQQQVELPGVGLNTNNMAMQQAAAERQSDTTGE